jgi:hypothetical protein
MCLECPLEKGEDLESRIRDEVKKGIYMDVEFIESLEPYEIIEKDNDRVTQHQIIIGFKALSSGDITELGPNIQTAGWFTRQEVSWYWDKISDDAKKLLVALQFVNETGEF